jgi:hypothetical protein
MVGNKPEKPAFLAAPENIHPIKTRIYQNYVFALFAASKKCYI